MPDDIQELRRQLEAERGLRAAADGENERLQAQIDAYAEDLGRLFQERHGHGQGDLAAELARARADVADESAQREALDALYSRSRAEAKGLSEQLETYGEELSKAYRKGQRAAGAKAHWWQRPVPFGLLSSGAGILAGGLAYGSLLAPSAPPPGYPMTLTGTPGTGTPGVQISATAGPGVRIASNGNVGMPGSDGLPGAGLDPAVAAATAAAMTLDGTPAANVDGSAGATAPGTGTPGSVVAGLSAGRLGAAGAAATAASLTADLSAAASATTAAARSGTAAANVGAAAAGTPVPGLAATVTALAGTSTAVVATASVGANTATAGASTATAGAGTAVAFAATASVEAATASAAAGTASVVAGTASAVASTASAVAGTASAVAATATQAAQPISTTAPLRTTEVATKPEAPTPDLRRCSIEMTVPPLRSGGAYLVHFTQRQAADIVVLWSHRDGEVTLEVEGGGAGALALAPSADAEGTPRDVVTPNVPAGDYRARLRNLSNGSVGATVVALFYDRPSACQPAPVGAIDDTAGPHADAPAPSPAATAAATPLPTNPTTATTPVVTRTPASTPTVASSPTPTLFPRPRLDCRPYLRGPSGYLEIQPAARLDTSGERLGSLPVRAKLVGPTAARVVTDQFVAAPGMAPRQLSLAGFGHYEFSVEADADLDTNCAWGYDHDQYR